MANDDEIQDGSQSEGIQDGDKHVFAIMVLAVLSVAVAGYGTFFLFQYAVYRKDRRAKARESSEAVLRTRLTTYQSI